MLSWRPRHELKRLQAAVFCFLASFYCVQAGSEPAEPTPEQAAIEQLAAKMPAGAQKILKESADPPAAPLRLLSFRGGASEGGPKGDSDYGVDPLEISYEKLAIPRSRGGNTKFAISATAETSSTSGSNVQTEVSVKAIHQHIADTVSNTGSVDESITPMVKPPGVHVLDVVARQIKNLGEEPDEKASANASLTRTLSRLDTLKKNLPDGGATYAAPTQQILNKLKNFNINPPSTEGDTGGTKPSAGGAIPRADIPTGSSTRPNAGPDLGPSKSPNTGSNTRPNTTPKTDLPSFDKGDQPNSDVTNPDAMRNKVAAATDKLPSEDPSALPSADTTDPSDNTAQPDWQPDDNASNNPATDTYGIINLDGKTGRSAIPGFDNFDIPTTDDGLPTIDFDALNEKIDALKGQIEGQVSVGDIKDRVNTAVDPKLGNIKATVDRKLAGIGADLSGKTANLTSKVDADLGQMASQVSSAVGKAYDAMQRQMQTQAADQYKKGNAVTIPSKQCNWPGSVFGGCPTGEKSSSKAARKAAYAKRDAYYKTGNQFNQAAAGMPAAKANAQASVYEKFGTATTQMNAGMSSAVSSVSDMVGSSSDSSNHQSGDTSHWDDARGPKYGSRSRLDDRSSIDALIELDDLTNNMAVNGTINAAIGNDAVANQYVSVIDGDTGTVKVRRADFLGTDNLAINVAVGDDTRALQIMDSIYDRGQSGEYGDATFISGNTGAINVVLAAGGSAEMLISTLMGSVKGSSRVISGVEAPINVALGANTSATSHLGVWQGVVEGTGNLTIQSTAALSAAIGDGTDATVRLASQGPKGHSNTLDITVISEGALTAPLGYDTSATIAAGNVDGRTGSANVHVTTGPVIAASLGSRSNTSNLIGSLSEGASVGGHYKNTVTAGTIIAFALGDNTHASNVVGAVQGRVGGSANINVAAGDILTGTLGERTEAETYIGSILGDVSGNANINVIVGSINTFAVGLSSGSDIYAKTYVGNVTSDQGSVNINVTHGAVVNLGVGLIIDLGVLGELKFVHQGCVLVGNSGRHPC